MLHLEFLLIISLIKVEAQNFSSPTTCESDTAKFLNEKCRSASECYGYPDTMLCANQICVCKDGYQPANLPNSWNSSRICTSITLGIGEVCYGSCPKPLVCKSSQTDGYDEFGYRIEGTSTCQCLAPYFLDQNGVCTMKCKTNQKYDPYTATCIQICRSTEVSIDGNCKAMASLGGKCQSSMQCQAPYSTCNAGICQCQNGFTRQGSICRAQSIHCPTGAAPTHGNDWIGCKFIVERPSPDHSFVRPTPFHQPYHTFRDNCPTGYFCLPMDWPPTNQTTGYCCPMIRLNCPIGQPLSGASCDQAAVPRFPTTTDATNSCPSETHFCFPVDLGGRVTAACCPRACSSDKMMQINGRCYAKAHLDESCQTTEQCVDFGSVCNRGICSCPKGYVALSQPDTQDKVCKADCQYNQVEYGESCVAALKLGQSCQNEPWRCPKNAKCGRNRVCVCVCPYVSLDNAYICAPSPSCYQLQGDTSYMFDNWSNVVPSVVNPVFCALGNQKYKGQLKVVNQCPYYQYCSPYLSDVGVCCDYQYSQSDQTCPDGNYSTGPCQTNADCGSSNDQYCNKVRSQGSRVVGFCCYKPTA